MLVIGLTGGIGSGKSAAANLFRQRGITVVDADIAARQAVEKGSPALQSIARHFGPDSLLADGTLNRQRLREIIFDNPEQKQWLENLLHPLIRQFIADQLGQSVSPYSILESPLLLETDQHRLTARVLVVDVPENVQIERVMSRDNVSKEHAIRILQSQASRQRRLANADDIILNTGSLTELRQKIDYLHQYYLKLATNTDC